jgi:serine/threonine protein kinase
LLNLNLQISRISTESDESPFHTGPGVANFTPYSALEVGRLLGRGSFGEVHQCRWKGEDAAIKSVTREGAARDELGREFSIMLKLRSPRIIQILAWTTDDKGKTCLVLEFARGGSLRTRLDLGGVFPPVRKKAMNWAYDVARGMEYLHEMRVMHCDLKSPNVLLDGDPGRGKVADFGIASERTVDVADPKHQSFASVVSYTQTRTVKGSPPWMAPEAINGKRGFASDVYAYAVILWELITGKFPWKGTPFVAVLYNVVVEGSRLPVSDTSHPLYSLMCRSWVEEQAKRPSFKQCTETVERLIYGKSSTPTAKAALPAGEGDRKLIRPQPSPLSKTQTALPKAQLRRGTAPSPVHSDLPERKHDHASTPQGAPAQLIDVLLTAKAEPEKKIGLRVVQGTCRIDQVAPHGMLAEWTESHNSTTLEGSDIVKVTYNDEPAITLASPQLEHRAPDLLREKLAKFAHAGGDLLLLVRVEGLQKPPITPVRGTSGRTSNPRLSSSGRSHSSTPVSSQRPQALTPRGARRSSTPPAHPFR